MRHALEDNVMISFIYILETSMLHESFRQKYVNRSLRSESLQWESR